MSCACASEPLLDNSESLPHAPSARTALRKYLALMPCCVMCRWCITGTPLNRGLDDLYGLFWFLHASPYSERHFWRRVLQEPYMAGCPAGVQPLLAPLTALEASQIVSHPPPLHECLQEPALLVPGGTTQQLADNMCVLRPHYSRSRQVSSLRF